MIDYPKVPDGWTSEPHNGHHTVISNGKGAVTIDWEKRGFRSGWSTIGSMTPASGTYSGRGWKERIVTDAIAYLDSVWREQKATTLKGGSHG